MSALLDALFAHEAEFTPDSDAQVRGLQALMANPERNRVLVAERGGRIVGMVTLQSVISTALGGPSALLEDLVVDPAYRGEGIGAKLLTHAIDTARAAGCIRLTLLTDEDNVDAHRFYRRFGFVRSPMVPLRLLVPPE